MWGDEGAAIETWKNVYRVPLEQMAAVIQVDGGILAVFSFLFVSLAV